MAKQGFKVIDSDIHVVEPKDLWLRYLEPEFVKDGPRPAEPGKGLWQIGERPVPVRANLPARQEDITIRRARTKERYKKLGRREGEDHSSPVDMIEAMDLEGLDLGVVFRTYTAHATGTDDIEPKLAPPFAVRSIIGCVIFATRSPAGCCRPPRWRFMTSI